MASRKPVLSPTRICAYLECAMKYRYLYVDRLGRYYVRARPAFSFGATLHRVLQAFHAEGAGQTREEMVSRLEQSWVAAGYQSAQEETEYRQAGVEVVEAYHAAAAARAEEARETLWTEKTLRLDMGPFALAGRVDRVDRWHDGTLEVIDYKSGRWETTPEEVAGDLAVSIYQLLLKRLHPGVPVVGTIYCLRSGIQASSRLSDEEAGRFEADLLVLGQDILSRDWEQVEPERIAACEWCDFLPRCERFWRQRERQPGM